MGDWYCGACDIDCGSFYRYQTHVAEFHPPSPEPAQQKSSMSALGELARTMFDIRMQEAKIEAEAKKYQEENGISFEGKVLKLLEDILERLPKKHEYGYIQCGKKVPTEQGGFGYCIRSQNHEGDCWQGYSRWGTL